MIQANLLQPDRIACYICALISPLEAQDRLIFNITHHVLSCLPFHALDSFNSQPLPFCSNLPTVCSWPLHLVFLFTDLFHCSTSLNYHQHKRTVSAPVSAAAFGVPRSFVSDSPKSVAHHLPPQFKMNGSRNSINQPSHHETDSDHTEERAAARNQFDAPQPSRLTMRADETTPTTESESFVKASGSPLEPVFASVTQGSQGSEVVDQNVSADEPEASLSWKCACVQDCNTGAGPRKAVSHFFGRNKTCTLEIPNEVWVWYCRKHYQRTRYRHGPGYGKTQAILVKDQMTKLQVWSDKNLENGQGPYIKGWTLALRKREQKHLDMVMGEAAAAGEDLSNVEFIANIPRWIVERLGSGLSHDDVFAILARFQDEIQDGMYEDLPEIEFLPEIIGGDKKGAGKPGRNRKQAKRMASEMSGSDQNKLGLEGPLPKQPRTAGGAVAASDFVLRNSVPGQPVNYEHSQYDNTGFRPTLPPISRQLFNGFEPTGYLPHRISNSRSSDSTSSVMNRPPSNVFSQSAPQWHSVNAMEFVGYPRDHQQYHHGQMVTGSSRPVPANEYGQG